MLKTKILEILQKQLRFFDCLNMTSAVKKLRLFDVRTSFESLKEVLEGLTEEERRCGDGSILHINTPEEWESLGLKGKSEYYFQNL